MATSTDSIDPTSLTPCQLAKLLSVVGNKPIAETQILDRLEEGAPISPAGTIHLVHFTAWLVAQSD